MKVEVVRSPRRSKTIQARMVDGVLRVHIPARMSVQEEQRWVSEMVGRMERRTSAARIDLMSRARSLARQHGLELPSSIRWVDNQESRWGSCTPATGTIRISSRLGREPAWVIDYVIVHELAHLSVSGHGPRFWKLVERYPLAERARGFLIARGLESGEPDEDADTSRLAEPGPAPVTGADAAGAVGRSAAGVGRAGGGGFQDGRAPGAGRSTGAGRAGGGTFQEGRAPGAGRSEGRAFEGGRTSEGRRAAGAGRAVAAGGAARQEGGSGLEPGDRRLPASSRRSR